MYKTFSSTKALLLLILFLLIKNKLWAQAGSIDSTFDNDGIVVTNFNYMEDFHSSSLIQADGKIVVFGWSDDGISKHLSMARYLTNGTLDLSFNTNGRVLDSLGDFRVTSGGLQSDGKIVIGGYFSDPFTFKDLMLVRYDSSGIIDSTFGNNGITSIDHNNIDNYIYSICIQTDDKIVIGGTETLSGNNKFLVSRFNSNGAIDSSFGINGFSSINLNGLDSRGQPLAIQADGKIFQAGIVMNNGFYDVGILRYNSNGLIDSTFGINGMIIKGLNNIHEQCSNIKVQPDGKIILAGITNSNLNFDFLAMRFHNNGIIDSIFGNAGVVTLPIGGNYDELFSVLMQPDGKYLLGGTSDNGVNVDYTIARLNSNGTLDSTFGMDGIVITDINNGDDNSASIALQTDNKIVLTGYSQLATADFAIVRYNNDVINSVTQPLKSSELYLYPNPANDIIKIESNENLLGSQLLISNSFGKVILKTKLTANKNIIDISNLISGTYVCTLVNHNTENILIKKLVIIR